MCYSDVGSLHISDEVNKMRTTLDIDERLLGDVIRAVGVKGKSKAVEEALRMYLRSWAAKKLIEAVGTIDLTENMEEFRRVDSLREEKLDRMRRGATEQNPVRAR